MGANWVHNEWLTLCSSVTSNKEWTTANWLFLNKKYSEKHRCYHTLLHIESMLKLFQKYQQQITNKDDFLFALFFHDSIYSVVFSGNEEKSADYTVRTLQQINYPAPQISTVNDYILAIKNHSTTNDMDLQFLLDFDLAVLGANEKTYLNYTQQIRREYKLYPDFLYKKGRIKMLEHFLNKKRIFQSEPLFQLYENQARFNIEEELNQY